MELIELKAKIIDNFEGNDVELNEIMRLIEADKSIFPFNEYEHLICTLIEKNKLTYEQYISIRSEYIPIKRKQNAYSNKSNTTT